MLEQYRLMKANTETPKERFYYNMKTERMRYINTYNPGLVMRWYFFDTSEIKDKKKRLVTYLHVHMHFTSPYKQKI